jgi:hypothetical protein
MPLGLEWRLRFRTGNGPRATNQETTMTNRMNTPASRITLGAVLLALAATASSCGMALPTQPAVEAGVTARQNAATSTELSPTVIDDGAPPAGGPGVQPPVGEVIVPTPGATFKGTKTGWWFNQHRRHNK